MREITTFFKKNTKHYLMLLPFFIIYIIFFLWPMMYGAAISLMKWNGIESPKFIGIANYVKVLQSPDLLAAARNLLIYAIFTMSIGITLSLFISLVASQLSNKWNYIFRSIFFIPCILPLFLSTSIWKWLMTPDYGIINIFLKEIGLQSVNWIAEPGFAIAAVVLVDLWRASGFNILIFMTGIKEIPNEYYEAADVDGATTWQKIRHITIPQLEPIIFLIVTNSIIGALQVFDIPWLMSMSVYNQYGGVNKVMLYPIMKIFGLTFGAQKFGEASAYAMLILTTTLLLTGAQFALRRRKV